MHYGPVVRVPLYTTAVPFLRVALLQPKQYYTSRWTPKTDHVLAYGCVVCAILERQPQKALRVAQDPLVPDGEIGSMIFQLDRRRPVQV
jgi:hypothetical protein